MSEIQTDKDSGIVRMIIDTKFYGWGAVIIAAQAYTDSCWMFVDGDVKDKLIVTMKPKNNNIDVETLGYEFHNFMLGLMQDAYSQE